MDRKKLRRDIAKVLNCHCIDSEANTPDFVLACLMVASLDLYIQTKRSEQTWRKESP